MRNQMLITYEKKSSRRNTDPTIRWIDSSISELEQLSLEAQEYDFLAGKSPQMMSESWQEEVE